MQSLLILGRQPALGLAELESLFGADKVQPVDNLAALVDLPSTDIPFNRLGGSLKLTKLLTELPTVEWDKLIKYIDKTLPKHLGYLPEGKIKLGLSAFGLNVNANTISRSTLQLKKTIKAAGRSVRVVPNNEPALNSAQVLHNQLTSPLGIELVLVRDGRTTWLAQTVAEQDIDAYAARDQQRPMRDTKVGMLPPKLAQIIINLTGLAPASSSPTVLDPFCGTGVILQEAQLMGFDAYGTDLEPRMVDYSLANIEWLQTAFRPQNQNSRIEVGDATNLDWQPPFDTIACETYLGRPFSSPPEPKVLDEVMSDVSLIHKRFLQNVARQTETGMRLCIAVPAWKTPTGFKHLKSLDNLEDLGYNRIEFVHARQEDLIYHRDGQVVARELVVLVRT